MTVINPNLEMLSRMRELQRMEAERAELQQEKAKRELRRKFAEKKVAEGCAAVDSERLQSLMKRWKELVVEREGDVVGRLQEAVSEKKDNTIEMRRSDAKIVKENIEMMLELAATSESDRATSAWIENQNWPEFAKEVQKLEESLMKREANINASQIAANQFRLQQ